ncbi:hypothetical protein SDC9_135734 [bioreactor metagenome]|uniref:Uncharacterized protein n=1 Tax=bioreactor metagenome TaxID=1076179 RepID=A0A645DGN0_9ZZZZ
MNVKATKLDIITAPAITIENSRKSLPVTPCKKTIGKKTATSVTVVAITAKKISLDPSIAAFLGFIPLSILVYMFSITTMASSTTSPIASTRASKVRMLMEKPARYIIKKEPTSEIGMAMIGIKVVLQLRKNRNIMSTTRKKACMIVFCTSLIESLIKIVLSKPIPTSISSGRLLFNSSIAFLASSTMFI